MNITSEEIDKVMGEELRKRSLFAAADVLEQLKKAFILLYNRMNMGESYNPNIVVCAYEQEIANKYGIVLTEMLKSVFPESCAEISEDELYGMDALSKDKEGRKLRLVRNFKAYSLKNLYNSFWQLEQDRWPCAVILCTTLENAEKIKEYENQDYRLYNYMCGYKVVIPEVDENTILKAIIERLKQDNYCFTKAFEKKLEAYIKAVYPDARLKNYAFMEDLIYRIFQAHYQKLVEDKQLDETDVPKSVKTEAIERKKCDQMADPDRGRVKDNRVPIESLEINTDKETLPNEKTLSNTVNILITNVSTISLRDGKTSTRRYEDENGNLFEGEMTNEAPIKSIAYRLGKKGYYLNKILFIASDTVRNHEVEINNKKWTHIEYLKDKIENFLKQYKDKTEYVDIEIKDEPSKDEVSTTVFDIYNRLLELAEGKNNINIFIEANGGVRYVLTMLLSLTKTLENYYENVHISEITSMVLKENPVSIMNTKDVFDTAQLTGIADEFVNYGRINSLQRYVAGHIKDLSPEQKQDVQSVLDMLEKISDDIQLCRTSMILEDFYGKDNLKVKIEAFSKNYGQKESPAVISIFLHILQLILNELNQAIYKDILLTEEASPIRYLPLMIEWCLNKSFVQQALTFAAERIPEYLFETKKIVLGDALEQYLSQIDTKKYEKNYYFIANIQDFIKFVINVRTEGILQIIKDSGKLDGIITEDNWKSVTTEDGWKCVTEGKGSRDGNGDKLIAERVIDLIKAYSNLDVPNLETKEIPKKEIVRLFKESEGFTIEDLDKNVSISKKISSPIKLVMRGKYKKDEEVKDHDLLKDVRSVVIRVLPGLVKIAISNNSEKYRKEARTVYNRMIDGFSFDVGLTEALKQRYSQKQSEKFLIKDVLDSGQITTSMESPEALQKFFYIYSVCKEQRNLSNHAHISDEDANVALNSNGLKRVIRILLQSC